ncbi:putative adhesin [Stackebrandtia albiflava]|uniref:Putative adhesin n=1 Tax=Stackebrandtia albiflava TaxID=406432 RepID=A0A562URP3_9ACTN|nr:DUF4097 family beta strand repeat-containing protein [Stackebrandtia albiflava]TWJ08268.1 putative adhesin [Stackebrandtia albiflava]
MPAFPTPTPITVEAELGVGDVHVTATDRDDTVVEVTPTDPDDESDRKAAEQTVVDFTDGRLRIVAPRRKPFHVTRKTRSVRVTIQVPTGSRLDVDTQMGDLWSTGRLGRCRFKSGAGHIRADLTGPLHVDTGAGRVTVGTAAGDTEVTTGTGRVDIGRVEGTAVVKNSNGDIALGTVTGRVLARTANGAVSVDRPHADVEARTSNGAVRVGSASGGSLVLKTGMGDVEVGIAEGVAARLDLGTGFGRAHSELDELGAPPAPAGRTVDVTAHSGFGDVTVRRAHPEGDPA